VDPAGPALFVIERVDERPQKSPLEFRRHVVDALEELVIPVAIAPEDAPRDSSRILSLLEPLEEQRDGGPRRPALAGPISACRTNVMSQSQAI